MDVDTHVQTQTQTLVDQHLARHPRTAQLARTDTSFAAAVDITTTVLSAVAQDTAPGQRVVVIQAALDRLLGDHLLAQHDAATDPVRLLAGIVSPTLPNGNIICDVTPASPPPIDGLLASSPLADAARREADGYRFAPGFGGTYQRRDVSAPGTLPGRSTVPAPTVMPDIAVDRVRLPEPGEIGILITPGAASSASRAKRPEQHMARLLCPW